MNTREKTPQELRREIEDLRARLEEAEETLRAIRSGEVDALVVSGPQGEQVYTLKGADHTYRVLVEGMNEGAVTMTTEGDILYCNDRFGKMVGAPLEQVIASSIYRFVVPADQPLFDALLRGGSPKNGRGEFALRAGDGTLVPVYLSFIILQMEGLPVVCMMATDLTEQKRHEEVVASERLARSILDQAAEAIVVCDENGQIIRASQMVRQLCGQNPLLQPFDAVFPLRIIPQQMWPSGEEAGHGEWFSLAPILRGERLLGVEAHLSRQDDEQLSLLVSAGPLLGTQDQILGCVITLTDITERLRAHRALRESEERLDTTLRSIGDAVIATDVQGVVTLMNPVAEELTGWNEGEAVGRRLEDVFNIVNRQTGGPTENPVARVLREGFVVGLADDTMLIAREGTERAIADSGAPIRDEEGNIMGTVVVFRDITERLRVEEERERLLADLEAKNRELESFAYTVSHDLRAPLVSIDGFSSVLQKEFYDQLGQQGQHYLDRIQANLSHIDALIGHLLALSRIGRVVGPIEEIDVSGLLAEIQQELALKLEEAGAEFVVQEPLPAIRADPDRIRQVFVNLIDNAVKFRSEERALRIEVGCQQERGFYCFHVADNGIGIAPRYHEQIFAPFRQLDPETEGVGMGLALVKKIVEHHGGRVWVESEEGRGATFYFTIPVITEKKEAEDG